MTDQETSRERGLGLGRKPRWWSLILVILLPLLVMAGLHLQESFLRYYGYALAPVAMVIGICNWIVFGSGLPWEKGRILYRNGWLLSLLVVGLGLGLFRWDDTFGGTSLVKPVWRWEQPRDADLPGLKPAGRQDEGIQFGEEGESRSWPQYLGPSRNGTVEGMVLETDWARHPPRELWRREIGLGWASFAVEGRRAVTMEQRGDEELVSCYDLESGTLLWVHADLGRFEAKMGGTGPRTTPTIRGGLVYTQGPTGRLNCLDLETGELRWSREVVEEWKLTLPDWGKSNSPLAVGDLVIVTGGTNQNGPLLLAFDRIRGELRWESEAGGTSFSSPAWIPLGSRNLLVSVNQLNVTAHDLSGATLWKWDWPQTWPKVGQPQVVEPHRLLFTASYGQGSHLVDFSGAQPETIWSSNRLKTKFSSAVIRGGYAYGLDEGVLACVDLRDGKRVWKGGRYGFGQNLLVDDVLLIQGERGELALVRATPDDYVELSRMEALSGTTWNVPTLAGKHLLVRNDQEAVCYELAVKLREEGSGNGPATPRH